MKTEANEIQLHEEDGVKMYSVVRIDRGAACEVCFQDVTETAKICRTEIHGRVGRESRRWDELYICEGCAYRVGSMFDTRNAGKELFQGVLQDRVYGVE